MKKTNNIIVTLGILVASFQALGQDPSYRQNQFNALIVNPAHAGANSYNDISTLANAQWGGFKGAPKTMTLSGNFNILKNFGLGVTFLQDELGPVKTNQFAINGAYHLKLSNTWRFSLGLRAIVGSTTVNLTNLDITQPFDPDMMSNLTTGLTYNAGWGVLLYHKNFFVGAAQPRVGKMDFLHRNMLLYVDNRGGHLGYMGGTIPLNATWQLRPNVVARYMEGLPLTVDLNAIMTHKMGLDFGVSYQLNSAIGGIVGYEINNRFYLGYSYTFPMSNVNKVNVQLHEMALALRWKFNNDKSRSQGPRFFN